MPRGQDNPRAVPVGEHQANGVAEEAGRTVRDQARVLKLHIQAKIGREVLADEPILPWLIRWAAMSVSRFKKGKDGKSPYERQKGRPCDTAVVQFGEVVMFRLPEAAHDRDQSLEERW